VTGLELYSLVFPVPAPDPVDTRPDLSCNGLQEIGAAVVSTARSGNEYYGRDGDDDDLIDRITKEGAHEVGHLLGLGHCSNRECIMFRPITLDEPDRKKKMLCPICRGQLEAHLVPH